MYSSSSGRLFEKGRLSEYIQMQISSAVAEAGNLGVDVFRANSDEQILEHITSKYRIDPLKLLEDEKDVTFNEGEADIRNDLNRAVRDRRRPAMVKSYQVSWRIPFTGTRQLWDLQPSSFLTTSVAGSIEGQSVLITANQPADSTDADRLNSELKSQLFQINKVVNFTNNDLQNYDSRLEQATGNAIAVRRREHERIADIKDALRITIEDAGEGSPLTPLSIEVHGISPLSSNIEDAGAFILDSDYEAILRVIRNMGVAMESSRATEGRDEEALRDILLVGLNASMTSGSAGGELFRKKGKTDIAVLFENRAAFVGECKLWKGPQYALDGLGQLLGYLTWRDAKTSLILFNNRNANFSSIQTKIDEVFKSHPLCLKSMPSGGGEWRYQFRKPDDEGRFVTVHVFLFDTHRSSGGG